MSDDTPLNQSEIALLNEIADINILLGLSYLGKEDDIPVKQSLCDRQYIHRLKTDRYIITTYGASWLSGFSKSMSEFEREKMLDWYVDTQYENMKAELIKKGDW